MSILDDYKENQYIAYRQLKKILNGKISHAYMFSTNNNIYSKDIIYSFIKSIICPFNYTNKDNCQGCNICTKIDNGNYLEFKEVYPDGLWIKKEQLSDLKKEMSTKPIEGKKLVYIIYEVEKLNKQAANSLLKFLEEPSDDIVAILVTNNSNLVIDTITSRCQNIIFNKNSIKEINNNVLDNNSTLRKVAFLFEKNVDEFILNDKNKVFIEDAVSFIKKYEENGIKLVNSTKKYFHDKFQNKDDIIFAFDLMILFYKDIIYYKLKNKIEIFEEYIEIIKEVNKKNTLDEITKKIIILLNLKELIKGNANVNLLIDKLIMDFAGRK